MYCLFYKDSIGSTGASPSATFFLAEKAQQKIQRSFSGKDCEKKTGRMGQDTWGVVVLEGLGFGSSL